MRLAYPIEIDHAEDGITITCPDVPGMATGGWGDLAANLAAAPEALAIALSQYVDDEQRLPTPSPADGRTVIAVPLLASAKLALHEAKLAAKLSNVELARRLGVDEKEVRRLLDIMHNSRMAHIEAALRALDCHLVVEVERAA
jgi:antitoxin HicB